MADKQFAPRLDHKVEVHDQKQIEIKLEYQPSGVDDEPKYSLEVLLFLPASLHIDEDVYPASSLYRDIHNYVRLKTPNMSLQEVLGAPHSPLMHLEAAALTPAPVSNTVIYEAKMLSCVFRGALRRFNREMNRTVAPPPMVATAGAQPWQDQPPAGVDASCLALADYALSSVNAVLSRWRVVTQMMSAKVDERTNASLRLIDEYMSLTVEQFFRKTVAELEGKVTGKDGTKARKLLMELLLQEQERRRQFAAQAVMSQQGDNERYTQRVGFLKKYCMSVLFLNTIKRPGRRAAEELVFAFAAGLAMLFAVFFTLAAQVRYSQASMQFVALVVVSYMLKDRLKEWARRRTASILGKFLYDRVTTIGDPVSRESVGALKEKVDYIQKKDVPSWLMDMRKTDDLFAVSVGELSESVLRYRKAITLDGDELPKVASGLSSGVTDIIRLSVGSFLVDMDDPEYALDYVDAEDLKPGKLRAAKSYVVDVGLRYVLDDGNAFEERRQVLRLTLDRNGIRKLEHIGGVPLVEPPRPSIV